MARLTNKQKAFVEAYLQNGMNGTLAAKQAGYKARNDATFAVIASENLRKPNILEQIDERLAEMAMSANEVLYRLTLHGKSHFGPFIDISGDGWKFDLSKVKELGHLVKSVSSTRHGIRIELYDAQSALVQLGKYHGLFKDQVEHSGSIKQASVNIYIPDNGRGDRD